MRLGSYVTLSGQEGFSDKVPLDLGPEKSAMQR